MPKPYTIVEGPDGMLCEVTVNADGTFSPRAWRPRRAPAEGFIVGVPLPMPLQRAVFSTGEAAMRAAQAIRRRQRRSMRIRLPGVSRQLWIPDTLFRVWAVEG